MTTTVTLFPHPFSRAYWREAAKQFSDLRMLCVAALLIAARVALKSLAIPVGPNLNIQIAFLVNALGAMIFGPVIAIPAAVVSDTLGALLFPSGAYFFPFVFVEIAGSVIFALFLWRAELSAGRVILARFSVVFVCNILMNPAIMIWYYQWLANGKVYRFITLPRIVKNVALFPAESFVLVLFLGLLMPALTKIGVLSPKQAKPVMQKKHYVLLAILFVVAALAVLAYYFLYLKK